MIDMSRTLVSHLSNTRNPPTTLATR